MKGLLVFALASVAIAKPSLKRQWVTPPPEHQWMTPPPEHHRKPEIPVDDHFEYRNPDFTDDGLELFESDMLMTEEQRSNLHDRQAVTNLWTSPVKFAITSSSSGDRTPIEAGIQHWRDNTCIQFEEVAEGASERHLSFIKSSGCWSYVGKTGSSGAQQISIGSGCTGLGTVAHEIGHAMGLFHQQSRTDRDTYVTINYENIQSGRENNFAIATSSLNHSVPYDLTSVMHYGSTYFTSNGLDTITVNNFLHAGLIGNRCCLSHRDKHIANIMYQCAASCSSPPTCQNGGYVQGDCTCACPSNTAGSNCETLNGGYYPDSDCGDLNMNSEGTITSPNYPSNFPTNIVCWWVITAGEGQTVKVSVTDMKMLYRSNGVCYWDHLSLRYSGDDNVDDQKACDEELTGQSFTSVGNRFIVRFVSGNYGWHRGFSADVEFVGNAVTTPSTTASTTSATTTAATTTEATTTEATTTAATTTAATTPASTTAPAGNCGGVSRR